MYKIEIMWIEEGVVRHQAAQSYKYRVDCTKEIIYLNVIPTYIAYDGSIAEKPSISFPITNILELIIDGKIYVEDGKSSELLTRITTKLLNS
jgi:hypothetical protein